MPSGPGGRAGTTVSSTLSTGAPERNLSKSTSNPENIVQVFFYSFQQ